MNLFHSCWMILLLLVVNQQVARARTVSADTLVPDLSSITDDRVYKLLTTDPVYLECWYNDITFVYEKIKTADLPEVTTIPMLGPDETFTATWYGKLSSGYKWRWGRQHHGVDLPLKIGDSVYAAFDGVVRYAQWNKSGYGNCVIIRHRNGLETLYAHLSKIEVSPNQYVSSGEPIALGGNTGRSFGAHLHFEIRYKDFSIDPESIVDFNTQKLKVDTFQFVKSATRGPRYSGDLSAIPASSIGDSLLFTPDGKDSTRSLETLQSEETPKEKSWEKTNPVPKKVVASPKAIKTYTIRKGDTYTSISKKTGVSIQTLKKLNPRQKETKLMPGKVIRIK